MNMHFVVTRLDRLCGDLLNFNGTYLFSFVGQAIAFGTAVRGKWHKRLLLLPANGAEGFVCEGGCALPSTDRFSLRLPAATLLRDGDGGLWICKVSH